MPPSATSKKQKRLDLSATSERRCRAPCSYVIPLVCSAFIGFLRNSFERLVVLLKIHKTAGRSIPFYKFARFRIEIELCTVIDRALSIVFSGVFSHFSILH